MRERLRGRILDRPFTVGDRAGRSGAAVRVRRRTRGAGVLCHALPFAYYAGLVPVVAALHTPVHPDNRADAGM
jgi:hypothetical protein